MAKKMTRTEKDKMLLERYGNAFVSPPITKTKKKTSKKKQATQTQ